jgi:hypothetical protein
MTRNVAIAILTCINLALIAMIATDTPTTILEYETVVRTETLHADDLTPDQLLDIIRRTDTITDTIDVDLDYECWLTLRTLDDTDAAAAAHYIANKWNGDTCAALDHHLTHDWH